jgi:hypothetical protein
VSCRRIVGSCHEIVEEIGKILLAKKNETCDDNTINEKVQQLEHTLGLLDAAFYYLNIPHQTDEERKKNKICSGSFIKAMAGHRVECDT